MKNLNNFDLEEKEFIDGIEKFRENESRDAIYRLARFIVEEFWKNEETMSDGLAAFLLIWNNSFYRFGRFNFGNLQETISKNKNRIENFKKKNISDFSKKDAKDIKELFNQFLEALQITTNKQNKMYGRKSPVAVAKTLHILAPDFFPLWDKEIAKAYKVNYQNNPADKYIEFMDKMKKLANKVKDYDELKKYSDKSLLKLIDEYNYAKFTKKWIKN